MKFPLENFVIIRPTLLKSDTSILGAYADTPLGKSSTAWQELTTINYETAAGKHKNSFFCTMLIPFQAVRF